MDKFLQMLAGNKILEEKFSDFNGKLMVVESPVYGIHIIGDGVTQSGGVAEDVWKASLQEIKNSQFKFKNCLILGLGGGSIAKIINEWWPKTLITGVDIDPVIVSLGEKYLDLKKRNVKTFIEDAFGFCKRAIKKETTFDLVLVDMYQGQNVPEEFSTKEFIEIVDKLLVKRGRAIFNRLYFGDKRKTAMVFLKMLEEVFDEVEPVFTEANVMFICKK